MSNVVIDLDVDFSAADEDEFAIQDSKIRDSIASHNGTVRNYDCDDRSGSNYSIDLPEDEVEDLVKDLKDRGFDSVVNSVL